MNQDQDLHATLATIQDDVRRIRVLFGISIIILALLLAVAAPLFLAVGWPDPTYPIDESVMDIEGEPIEEPVVDTEPTTETEQTEDTQEPSVDVEMESAI